VLATVAALALAGEAPGKGRRAMAQPVALPPRRGERLVLGPLTTTVSYPDWRIDWRAPFLKPSQTASQRQNKASATKVPKLALPAGR
jgi:hypothetical protein